MSDLAHILVDILQRQENLLREILEREERREEREERREERQLASAERQENLLREILERLRPSDVSSIARENKFY